jgi:hypothetical protein
VPMASKPAATSKPEQQGIQLAVRVNAQFATK